MTRLRLVPALACLTVTLLSPLSEAATERRPYWTAIDAFFELLAVEEPFNAVDRLTESSNYRDVMMDELENIKLQLASLDRRMGKYRSHERLIERVVADRFAYIYVFVAYDRQPLKMEFQFYRAEDTWRFHNYSFSDKITEDIAVNAQYDLLDEIW